MVDANNTTNAANLTIDTPSNITIEAWHKLEGHVVEKRYNAGFIILSYLVSLVGAWTALELLNLRTYGRGRYNWTLLVISSVSMGGVAIWCMHFIGDHALILGHGDPKLQISYDSTIMTSESFFLPVLVFFISFWAVGSHETVNVPRVCLGGTLAGLGTCGMHYLGQASISNYTCYYTIAWVVVSAFIAIVGCIVSIFIFFVWRSTWATRWWKRGISASLLAIAVSGMHWLSSIGTHYRLSARKPTSSSDDSRYMITTAAIVLTSVACGAHLFLRALRHIRKLDVINSSQKLSLSTAIFDKHGRILVSPEGLLPTRKVANSFIEGNMNDVFSISHPAFLWIFRTARNWSCVKNIIPAMRLNIDAHCHEHRLGASHDVSLMTDDGEPIEDYSIVFRELFCIAAADIADELGRPLGALGCLFDEVIPTGLRISTKAVIKSRINKVSDLVDKIVAEITFKIKGGRRVIRRPRKDLEKGADGIGTGQLLFLVKKVHHQERDALQAAGYRFAEIDKVVHNLSEILQIKPDPLVKHLKNMWDYASHDNMLEPGCHLACFAIRASVKGGFDIVVRKDAKSQLPTMTLPFEELEDWQLNFLHAMNTLNVAECQRFLSKAVKAKELPEREKTFSNQVLTTLQSLKYEIGDPIFGEACLIAKPIQAPCRGTSANSRPGQAILIAFRLMVPIHTRRAPGKKCDFAPISLFKLRQRVYKNSLDHAFFARSIYREFSPVFQKTSHESVAQRRHQLSHWRMHKDSSQNDVEVVEDLDPFGNVITKIVTKREAQSRPSKLKSMWTNGRNISMKNKTAEAKALEVGIANSLQALGGILVSSDVIREVRKASDRQTEGKGQGFEAGGHANKSGVTANAMEDVDPPTFVDEMFQICVKNSAMPH